jgi:hypothetical protein
MGIDPLVLFASVSGFVLGFAFMIGAACSKYFEGLLLILVRRPYGKCHCMVYIISFYVFILTIAGTIIRHW